MSAPHNARSNDGRSIWEFVQASPLEVTRFLVDVAMLRMDGEGDDGEGEPWIMENDDAYDTVHSLIGNARAILGWTPGQPPLDHPDYAAAKVMGYSP
jgi:hypothetical protein